MRESLEQKNARTVRKLVFAAIGMFGFAFALVPLYNVLCDITGLNGRTDSKAAKAASEVDESRIVTVEFITDTAPDMPWEFRPEIPSMQVYPGQVVSVNFYARNTARDVVIGQAIPSVTPGRAAAHFKKTQCFCFDKQELDGGKDIMMPVIFYIDPDLPEAVGTVTLSYRMFNITDTATAVSHNDTAAAGGGA